MSLEHSALSIEGVFADTGPLAQALAGFEPRDGQRQMAAAVSGVIERGGTLLAEAGTGTGKTLAYLIPAILSRQRVLVSTGTKNLQEQIFFKDLPTLREALGVPIHGDADEGALELPVPASLSDVSDGVSATSGGLLRTARTSGLPPGHPGMGEEHRRPATAPSCATCPRTCRCGRRSRPRPTPASAPSARATATASSR